jgi:hypothetical protein
MRLLIMPFHPTYYYFFPLRPKYLPQHPILDTTTYTNMKWKLNKKTFLLNKPKNHHHNLKEGGEGKQSVHNCFTLSFKKWTVLVCVCAPPRHRTHFIWCTAYSLRNNFSNINCFLHKSVDF